MAANASAPAATQFNLRRLVAARLGQSRRQEFTTILAVAGGLSRLANSCRTRSGQSQSGAAAQLADNRREKMNNCKLMRRRRRAARAQCGAGGSRRRSAAPQTCAQSDVISETQLRAHLAADPINSFAAAAAAADVGKRRSAGQVGGKASRWLSSPRLDSARPLWPQSQPPRVNQVVGRLRAKRNNKLIWGISRSRNSIRRTKSAAAGEREAAAGRPVGKADRRPPHAFHLRFRKQSSRATSVFG